MDLKREPGLDEMANMKAKYDRLAALPGWQRLSKTCPMLATWDDHDYGKNEIGAEYPHKDESQQLLTRVHPRAPASRDDAPLRRLRGSFGAGLTGGIARSG